jgi:hypothetical protein
MFLLLQKKWNLFSVHVAMAGTGLYQLSRKIRFVRKEAKHVPSYLHFRYLVVDDVVVYADLILCRQDYFSDEEAAAQREG